ncbi:hypothetical protein [Flammeovirga aprica]|uniref:Uncharacterized protein n=1 Tax=Flammeovirga aprica JL-4 TaxID=694437 RepID=A0A7X9XDJ1_9BACT|nr:hypothetical protein [Flammeovirga aprica]NME72853.1 hypothetical protein [Flammeovirga aprica JL-4]
MKKYFSLGGSLYRVDHSILKIATDQIFGEEKVKLKVRVYGYDLSYENEILEFYLSTTDNKEDIYLLDCLYSGEESTFKSFFARLVECFDSYEFMYLLDYTQVNEYGDEISEEISVKSNNFDDNNLN